MEEQEKCALTPQQLVELGAFLSIKKNEKNKIRLGVQAAIAKVRFDIPDVLKQAELSYDAMLQACPGIQSVKVRLLIFAVDIEYDDAVIPPTLWEDLVNQQASPALLAYLEAALSALIDSVSAQD